MGWQALTDDLQWREGQGLRLYSPTRLHSELVPGLWSNDAQIALFGHNQHTGYDQFYCPMHESNHPIALQYVGWTPDEGETICYRGKCPECGHETSTRWKGWSPPRPGPFR